MYGSNHLPRKIGHIVPPTLKRFQNEASEGSEVSVEKREKEKKLPRYVDVDRCRQRYT